ncbi:hypothetical protein Tco_0397962 [Tanacetum coccineum]
MNIHGDLLKLWSVKKYRSRIRKVVVVQWWCCGFGPAMVVLLLWWWCCCCGGGCAAAVVVLWWLCCVDSRLFGLEYSEHYVEGINPFRRLLFGSDIDGDHITSQMLLDMINSEAFDKLQDDDAVVVCQLAVLHLVLLGRQPAHNIPKWWFRLIVDKKWETYPWGSYVWAKLYRQLRNANVSRWDRFYASQARPNSPLAKYTLSGFTWALRVVAWANVARFKRENLEDFSDGARPNRRLRPDAFEAKAEWWVCSRDFFDGRIREAPPIPSPELQQKNDAQEKMLKEVYNFYKGQSKPVEVREHYGLTDFSGFQNSQGFQQGVSKMFTTQASSSFFDVGKTTPIYPATFEQPMPSRWNDYISLHNVDPNKVVRNEYVDCLRFLESPESIYLDFFIKGFVVDVRFWRELVPYLCKGAISTESNPNHIGWLSDNVYMPINSGGRIPSLIDHMSKWTNVFNVLSKKLAILKEQDGDHTISTLEIRGYDGGGGDMVVRDGLKGCLDHRILRSPPIFSPLQ